MDCRLASQVRLPSLFVVLKGLHQRVDIAKMSGDVPVSQSTNENSAGFLPLHGCARDEGAVQVDDLASERSGRS
eukprot:11399091-Heterocapsa_arctica.AAC.1